MLSCGWKELHNSSLMVFPLGKVIMIVPNLTYSLALNKGYVTIRFRFSLLNNVIQVTVDFLCSFLWLFSCISST